MRIMFMGTPEISMTCLRKLIEDGHEVVAVVTREDKPRGRGNVMTHTPVKVLAEENNIPTFTPKTLKDDAFMSLLSEYNPELIAVVAYGKILPKSVLDFPKYGCVNLHVSLLPAYRGAAPMQRAIMNGESRTGVTVMYMDEGLDTGDIITAAEFEISESDDFEAIHDRSAEIGAALLSKTVYEIAEGKATRTPQDGSKASYAEKIEKEDCKIDFTLDGRTCQCRIRGVTPIPGAFCFQNGKMLKITKCSVERINGLRTPGEVVEISGVGDGFITVACGTDAIKITKLKPEGKGVMSAGDYVRGRKIALGEILE